MQYQVNLKQTEEGYVVWCPSLPGCASQGATKEEALINIQDAIESYLEVAQELNQEIESYYLECPKCNDHCYINNSFDKIQNQLKLWLHNSNKMNSQQLFIQKQMANRWQTIRFSFIGLR